MRQDPVVRAVARESVLASMVRPGLRALYLFVVLATVLATLISVLGERSATLDAAERDSARLARVLEQHFAGALGTIDLAFETLAAETGVPPVDEPGRLRLHGRLRQMKQRLPSLAGLLVIDREAMLVASATNASPRPLSFAERDYFAHHRDVPGGGLYLGSPVTGKLDGVPLIPVTRRLDDGAGGFAGLIGGGIDLAGFERFYESLALPARASVALLREDGLLLLRFPDSARYAGRRLNGPGVDLERLRSEETVTARVTSPLDGVERIVSSRRLSAYGATAIVTLSVPEVLVAWRRVALERSAIALAGLAVLTVLFVLVGRQLRIIRRSNERFESVFRASPVGMAITIEEDGRVVDINPALRRMLGLDDRPVERLTTRDLGFWSSAEQRAAMLDQLHLNGRFGPMEIHLAGGSGLTVLLSAETVRFGDEVRVLKMVHDISAQKSVESALRASQARLSSLVETTPVGVFEADGEGRVTYFNDRWSRISGMTREQGMDEGWLEAVHPEDRQMVTEAWRAAVAAGRPYEAEFRFRHPEGREVWVREEAVPLREGSGQAFGFVGVTIDTTEARRAAQQQRLAATVFNSAGDGILMLDADLRILVKNPAVVAMSGFPASDRIGEMPPSLSEPLLAKERLAQIVAEATQRGVWRGELVARRRDGATYPIWLTLTPVRGAGGAVEQFVAIFEDISERKRLDEDLRHMAQHDHLTGLPNRLLLADRTAHAIQLARRHGRQAALLYADLDRFKDVNDSLGHTMGDRLLTEVARRLRACVRNTDTVSRQGGDEFVILLSEVNGQEDVATAGRKLLDAVAQPYRIDGHELIVTPSLGAALFPEDGEDLETLLKHADAALNHAKEAGRFQLRFFEKRMNERAQERLGLETSLRKALARSEFTLAFQPVIELRGGAAVAAEALLRWRHPERGEVSPATFIPFAEETGLIVPMGKWVFEEACRAALALDSAGVRGLRLAVNLSAVQFRQPGLPGELRAALDAAGLGGERFELEVTESALMHDVDRAAAALGALKDMGFSIAIDDFGTGWSSLAYLTRLPIDKLKIDRSFIRDITEDRDDAAIVAAILQMAGSLGLGVVAEGVETVEQLDYLVARGCPLAQGFHFARPLTLEGLAAFARTRPVPADA